jgi:tRNA threonylcarbamoyladenosine biosynthesis protein TsaB
MPLLLSIESATSVCSVALHNQSQLIAAKENQIPQTTATQIMPMIDALFAEAKVGIKDLSGVVVSEGPGSYTGLRIGVATAKGICFALNIPLVSINTLALLAYQLKIRQGSNLDRNTLLCPMLDARRHEVYCMLLNAQLNQIEPTQAKVIDAESFSSNLNTQIIFFGDGSDKCKSIINHPNAIFVQGIVPKAESLGEMGFAKWQNSDFVDVTQFEPYYLKDFMFKKPNLS